MMKEGGYNQFCPVAKAAAVLGERWTILVVRELLTGATRFSDLQKSLPRASPAIITTRLQQLEGSGILIRCEDDTGHRPTYHLTPAGLALRPVLIALGEWSSQWIKTSLRDDEIDEYLLMKDVQRRLQFNELPKTDATIQFNFRGSAARKRWWIVVGNDNVDLCDQDPGREPDIFIEAQIRAFIEVWLGKRKLSDALKKRTISTSGDRAFQRSMKRWLGFSLFAPNTPQT